MKLKILVLLIVQQLCDAIIIYPDYSTHPCIRTCVKGESMKCYYKLYFEELFSMENDCLLCLNGTVDDCFNPSCIVVDSTSRKINVFNRRIPAPSIQVCEGDEVIVDVENKIRDMVLTVHWHGMHQKCSQFMDGVPMIMQCPIIPFTTFRYRYKATPAGTHMYHAHTGVQRANGAYGSLIVKKPPKQNVHINLYHFDIPQHVISLVEWFKQPPEIIVAKMNRMKILTPTDLSAIIVGGRGCQGDNKVPPIRYRVKKGYKYRFRMIHVGATVCPIELRIHAHRLLVIAIDGFDVEPFEVDSYILTNGERVDFVVTCDKPVDSYWMKFKGSMFCAALEGSGILMYDDCVNKGLPTTVDVPNVNAKTGNCINVPCSQPNCVNYCNMKSVVKTNSEFRQTPCFKYYVALSMERYVKPDYRGVGVTTMMTPLLNNISFTQPSTPLIFDPKDQPYCNNEERDICNKNESICCCMHSIRIPLGCLVELILVDLGKNVFLAHPMHLHGYHFRIVASDRLGENTTVEAVKELDRQGKIIRNLDNPIYKDTVPVPDGGYVIIRFIADNPGPWIFHCHVDFHMDSGMKMVVWVGDKPIKLPKNFPRCGNFYDDTTTKCRK